MHHSVFRQVPGARSITVSAILLVFGMFAGAQPLFGTGPGREVAGRPVAADASARRASLLSNTRLGNADELTEAAVRALSPYVTRSSHPEALRMAFRAYYNYRAARPHHVRKPYLYYVDFGLGSGTPRGYVFDMERRTVMDGPFTVAHGRGSAPGGAAVPTVFSNRPGSKASSLGLYLAQETYGFGGRSGGRAYRSVGLRLSGESGEFNSAARRRAIVAHGAPYVTSSRAGRSEGCPSMEQHRAQRLLPMLANGGVVFIFSPNNARWLRSDPWIHAG